VKQGRSILVVEDEALIAMDIQAQLLQAGVARCRIAATGERSTVLAREEAFDLIIMDNHLAGAMEGLDAARAIRAHSAVPIIIMSGYPRDEVFLKRVRPLGPVTCLDKPVEAEALLQAVEAALGD
jgi:CheY-like chemotaxis protein